MSGYAFGDTEHAAKRLDLVAEVFEAPTRAFLEAHAPKGVPLAVDLGCGPGNTTQLLSAVTGAARVVGLDASSAYVRRARSSWTDLEFAVHDVTQTPFPTGPADLLSARYVLAHLAEPPTVVRTWLTQVAPGGRLLVEEPHAIELPDPALRDYLALAEALLESRGVSMYPGTAIDRAEPASRQVVTHPVPVPTAARMFAMNLEAWRSDPAVTATPTELTHLGLALRTLAERGSGEAVWHLYQAVFVAAVGPGGV